ncbi:glycosyltransferase family 4 protein [Candidatus Latescibacterota bacterium]
MKVCHLTSVHIPFDTRIFYKECMSLHRAGHEVHLIAPWESDETVEGIFLHGIRPRTGKLRRILFTPVSVLKKALSINAGIYHFHDPELIPAGVILRFLGKKVIYDVHEDYPATMPTKKFIPSLLRPLAGWLIGLLERATSGWFTAVVVVTPSILERFCRFTGNVTAVHNFPLVTDRHIPSWENRSNSVCYIGSIAVNRGAREMVSAIGIARSNREATLAIAGNFTTEILEDEITGHLKKSGVDYRGFLDRGEVDLLMDESKAGLVLLHPEPRYMVSLPNKLFEYMAAGLPVIASDFPLWRSIIERESCGLVVNPLDPEEVAQAICRLLDNPEEAQAMGHRGRAAIEREYRWECEEKKLLKLYEEHSP